MLTQEAATVNLIPSDEQNLQSDEPITYCGIANGDRATDYTADALHRLQASSVSLTFLKRIVGETGFKTKAKSFPIMPFS